MRVLSYVSLLVVAVAAAPVSGCGQGSRSSESAHAPQERANSEVVAKLKEEGLERSQVMDTVRYLTEAFDPRLTGSPNLKAAQEWVATKLADCGLENTHLEPWGPFGRGWTLEGFTANVVEPRFFPLIAYPRAWSPSTDGLVRGELVYLEVKVEADLEKYKGKLKDAIVMISPLRDVSASFDAPSTRHSEESLRALATARPGDRPAWFPTSPEQKTEYQRRTQLQRVKRHLCYAEGAAVILEEAGRGDGGTVFVQHVVYGYSPDTPFTSRPRPWAKDAPRPIPQIDLSVEHYNGLIRMIELGLRPTLELNIVGKFHEDDLMAYNVVADIPGSDLKDEIVMLGAHIDSVHSGTGAADNAAGSAVCMEAVRMLKAPGLRPRRTIRIALF